MRFESLTPTLNDSDLLFPAISNYCCWSCSRALVHTANLATSTAFSNMSLPLLSMTLASLLGVENYQMWLWVATAT